MNDLVLSVLSFFLLLLIASFTIRPSEKLQVPHTTFLVFVGMTIYFLGILFPSLQFFQHLNLSKDLIFFVFLPTLIFESAFQMSAKKILEEKWTISVLAIVSYLFSTFFIAFVFWGVLFLLGMELPLLFLLLFGAIISATDPVAVLAVFKKLGVTPRLSRLFEGESLFNDGTSWAFFVVLLEVILHKDAIFTATEVEFGIIKFVVMIFGGIGFGWVMGKIFTFLIQKARDEEVIQLTLTLVMAHLTFLLADSAHYFLHFFGQTFEISAIIATVVASIMLGSFGIQKFTPPVRKMMHRFWEHFAFIANSLIFILIGFLAAPYLSLHIMHYAWLPIVLMIGIVIIGRMLSIYIPLYFFNKIVSEKSDLFLPKSWLKMLSWASLRGAIAVAAILMIPSDISFPGWDFALSPKEMIDILVISAILFTLFFKSMTLEKMVKKMNLATLSNNENIELLESELLLFNYTIEELYNLKKRNIISEENFKLILQQYTKEKEKIRNEIVLFLSSLETKEEISQMLNLHTLFIERKILQILLDRNEITEKTFWRLSDKLNRQEDRINHHQSQVKNDPMSEEELQDIAEEESKVRYQNARARSIVTGKVIKRISELRSIDSGIPDEIFVPILERYTSWRDASLRMEEFLRSKYPDIVLQAEKEIVENFLHSHLESKIVLLQEKSIISSKSVLKVLENKFHCHISH